jgi:hypothetical protein
MFSRNYAIELSTKSGIWNCTLVESDHKFIDKPIRSLALVCIVSNHGHKAEEEYTSELYNQFSTFLSETSQNEATSKMIFCGLAAGSAGLAMAQT